MNIALLKVLMGVRQEHLNAEELLTRAAWRSRCAAARAKRIQAAREFYRANPAAAQLQREHAPQWWAENMSLQEQEP